MPDLWVCAPLAYFSDVHAVVLVLLDAWFAFQRHDTLCTVVSAFLNHHAVLQSHLLTLFHGNYRTFLRPRGVGSAMVDVISQKTRVAKLHLAQYKLGRKIERVKKTQNATTAINDTIAQMPRKIAIST